MSPLELKFGSYYSPEGPSQIALKATCPLVLI
jgi:hypothetical protein